MAELELTGEVTQASFTLKVPQEMILGRTRKIYFYRDDKRLQHGSSGKLTPFGRSVLTELMMSLMVLSLVIENHAIQIEIDLSEDSPRELPGELQELQGYVPDEVLSRLNDRGRAIAGLVAGIYEDSFSPLPAA